MKTLMKSVLLTATAGLFLIPVSASATTILPSAMAQDTIVKKDTIVADTVKKEVPPMYFAQEEVTYTKIETSTLPEAITKGVTEKFADYTIEEAQKGSDNSYKLIIKKNDEKQTVIFNEKGEQVKEKTEGKTETILV